MSRDSLEINRVDIVDARELLKNLPSDVVAAIVIREGLDNVARMIKLFSEGDEHGKGFVEGLAMSLCGVGNPPGQDGSIASTLGAIAEALEKRHG